MTPRRLLLAIAVAALAVGTLYVVEVVLPEREARRRDRATLLLAQDGELLDFAVSRGGVTWTFTPRGDGAWRIDTPDHGELTADVRAVDDVRRALRGARIVSVVLDDWTSASDRGQYGLDPELVGLSWTDGPGARRVLRLGRLAPDGRHAYALDGSGRLVLVPRAVLDAVKWELDHYRAKSVLALGWDDVERVQLERPRPLLPGASARLVFARDRHPQGIPGAWRMVEPVDTTAHDQNLDALVSKLGGLQALGFGAERPTAEDLAAAGLSPPAAVVTLWTEADAAPAVVLEIGDPGEHEGTTWARTPGGPLVLVRSDLRGDALLPADFLREARAFPLPRWNLTEVAIDKPGRQESLELTLSLDEEAGWRAVRPVEAPLRDEFVHDFLLHLDSVRLGRFESVSPTDAPAADFDGPGSFRLRGRAAMPGGPTPSVEVSVSRPHRGPDGDLYATVRIQDGAGRLTVGLVRGRAFDRSLDDARAILREAREAAELLREHGRSPDEP